MLCLLLSSSSLIQMVLEPEQVRSINHSEHPQDQKTLIIQKTTGSETGMDTYLSCFPYEDFTLQRPS
uniref:Secreted protein n=1 Tax=Steinernema glaseri TaxID=37863 RepID=A0A1I7ZGM5_9BILA